MTSGDTDIAKFELSSEFGSAKARSSIRKDKEPKKESGKMYIYSKQINENAIREDKIIRKIDKDNISKMIESLRNIATSRGIDYLELNHNCRDWINKILVDRNEDNNIIKCLLNDFTDSMMTRMREKEKYVISIVSNNYVILCHSKTKESTITSGWKVVQRMLDRDNVDRFVLFINENNSINAYYYEHYPSESFIEWLGIPEREAFYYLGGKNRFNIDIAGMRCSIELQDDEVEKLFLNKNDNLKIERNQLYLDMPISILQIGSIRVGKKQFKTIPEFLQIFLAKRYELKYYQDEYKKLMNSLDPLIFPYIDDEEILSKIISGEEQIHLRKRNPNFIIIFATERGAKETIQFRESFIQKIYSSFVNNYPLRIFHAGMKLYPRISGPLTIKSMTIFNNINQNEMMQELVKFYNDTQLRDILLEKAISYSLFYLLYQENRTKPISILFKKLYTEIGNTISIGSKILEHESNVIEFKSSDYLQGNDDDIIKRVSEDLDKKVLNNDFKIYFFGIDEKTHEIESINSRRFNSDRIGSIENKLRIKTGLSLCLIKVPLDKGTIMVMTATKK